MNLHVATAPAPRTCFGHNRATCQVDAGADDDRIIVRVVEKLDRAAQHPATALPKRLLSLLLWLHSWLRFLRVSWPITGTRITAFIRSRVVIDGLDKFVAFCAFHPAPMQALGNPLLPLFLILFTAKAPATICPAPRQRSCIRRTLPPPGVAAGLATASREGARQTRQLSHPCANTSDTPQCVR